MGTFEYALSYIEQGMAPVPIPFRRKGPVLKGWQELRLTKVTAGEYFKEGEQNIGILAQFVRKCDDPLLARRGRLVPFYLAEERRFDPDPHGHLAYGKRCVALL